MYLLNNLSFRDREQDQPQVADYLAENPHENVRIRPDVELRNAWETGRIYALSHDAKLCGVSLVYSFETADQVFYEIGTVRVTMNGFGLQEFVNAVQIFQARVIEEDGNGSSEIFAVAKSGTGSFHVLNEKLRLQEFTPPEALATLRASRGLPFDPKKSVLRCEEASVQAATHLLRSCHIAGNRFRTPKGAEEVVIMARWFTPQVAALLDA